MVDSNNWAVVRVVHWSPCEQYDIQRLKQWFWHKA